MDSEQPPLTRSTRERISGRAALVLFHPEAIREMVFFEPNEQELILKEVDKLGKLTKKLTKKQKGAD